MSKSTLLILGPGYIGGSLLYVLFYLFIHEAYIDMLQCRLAQA